MDAHEATALTRRQDAQASNLPASSDRKYKLQADDADIQQEIAKKKQAQLDRRRRRAQHRQRMLANKIATYNQNDNANSASSSSSSSTSE